MANKNSKFMKPVKVSADLSQIVGKGPMPRTEVTKKLWVYIKKHDLQNPSKRREIIPDTKLALVLGKKPIDMFAMTKKVSEHLG